MSREPDTWDVESMRPLVVAWAERVESEVSRFDRLLPEAQERGTVLHPPATEEQIVSAEQRLGMQLPPSYRAFLQLANGADASDGADLAAWGVPNGFLSVAQVLPTAEADAVGVEIWCDQAAGDFTVDMDAPPTAGASKMVGYFEPYRHGLLISHQIDTTRYALVPREGQEEWELWEMYWEGATAHFSFADWLQWRLSCPSRRPDPARVEEYYEAARTGKTVKTPWGQTPLQALAEFDGERALTLALAAAEGNGDERVAVALLGQIGDPVALPILRRVAAEAREWAGRATALSSIEAIAPEEGRSMIATATGDPDPELREWARRVAPTGNSRVIHRRKLEDGRTVAVRRHTADDWEIWIEGEPGLSLGRPLDSCLAEVIGFRVAHEQWPKWIDDWAAEIKST